MRITCDKHVWHIPAFGFVLTIGTPMGNLIINVGGAKLVISAVSQAPAAPSNLVANAVSSASINLTWTDNSNNETSFTLERSLDGTSGWLALAPIAANSTFASDTGLAASTTYYYRILASNGADSGAYSANASATTNSNSALAAPTNLRLTTNEGEYATVDWDDNTGGTAITQTSLFDGHWYDDYYGNAAAGVTTKRFYSLTEIRTYKVRLRAIDGLGGLGSWSDEITFITSPKIPGSFHAAGTSPRRMIMRWTDPSLYEQGFEVRWSLAGQNTWSSLTTAANVIQAEITGLTPSTSYDVQVRSLHSSANSSYTAIVTKATPAETVPAAPSAVSLLAITNARLDAHWTRNSTNEDSFEVQYCGDSGGSPNGIWTAAGSTIPELTIHPITGLSTSTLYWARVRAVNNAGASAWVVSTASCSTSAVNASPTGWEPSLQWTPDQQAIWNQMKADYDANPTGTTLAIKVYASLKAIAEAAGTLSEAYSDNGTSCTFMYQITGDVAWANKAIPTFMNVVNSIGLYSDNGRETLVEAITQFDWLYPAMGPLDRKFVIDKFKSLAQAELDNFYPIDSDQTVGAAYGSAAMLAHSAAVLDDPTTANYLSNSLTGGLTPTAANYASNRNALYAYLTVLAAGGEWIESTEYNLGTIKFLLMLAYGIKTATGVDYLSEVSAEHRNMIRVLIAQLTPSLSEAVQWSDNQQVRTARWPERTAGIGELAGLAKGTDEGKWALQLYYEKFAGNGYVALDRSMVTRSLYMLDPYAVRADWRSDLFTHYASGQGTYYHRDGWGTNDSLFHMRFEPKPIPVHHQQKAIGDFQLWRKNEWAITHPIGDGYGNWDWYSNNEMGVGGLTMFINHSTIGQETASDRSWAWGAGTTGGKYYGASEPIFCNEMTRSIVYLPGTTKAMDTIITFDRVDAVDPLSLSTVPQINALYNATEVTLLLDSKFGGAGLKQWTIHAPVEPSHTGNALTWDTTGGQHVRVQFLLPSAITVTTWDEKAIAFTPNSFLDSERLWQARVQPNPTHQWDTFLSVIQVYDGSTPAVPTLIQSSAGQTASGALIQRTGDNDHVVMFGARANAGNRLITTGYTASWTQATAAAKVILTDLDPAKTWTYTIDGGGSTSLTVSANGIGVFTVNTAASHTLVLTGT